jgi:hypothetical protein
MHTQGPGTYVFPFSYRHPCKGCFVTSVKTDRHYTYRSYQKHAALTCTIFPISFCLFFNLFIHFLLLITYSYLIYLLNVYFFFISQNVKGLDGAAAP